MSKRLFAILSVSLMLILCACGGGTEPSANTASPTQPPAETSALPSQPAPEPSEAASPTPSPEESLAPTDTAPAAFSIDDLALEIDGTTYKIKDNAADILAKLGDGYEYSEAVSCVFDGMDKVHTYPELEICTYPDGDNDIIDQFLLLDDTYQTTRGIKVGSTKADIEAAYGDGYFMDGPYMTYTISGDETDIESPRCYFELDDSDTVIAISLHYPTVEA